MKLSRYEQNQLNAKNEIIDHIKSDQFYITEFLQHYYDNRVDACLMLQFQADRLEIDDRHIIDYIELTEEIFHKVR